MNIESQSTTVQHVHQIDNCPFCHQGNDRFQSTTVQHAHQTESLSTLNIEYRGLPLSALLPIPKTPSPDGKLPQLWIYGSLWDPITLPMSLENVDRLIAEGYVQTSASLAALESQLYQTARLVIDEEHQKVQTWYKPDPNGQEPLPVILAFSIDANPEPQQIPMLNPFPPPQFGDYAFVEQDDETLVSYCIMGTTPPMPPHVRSLWGMLGEMLKVISAPLLWPAFTERIVLASNELQYWNKLHSLAQQEKLALEPTRTQLFVTQVALRAAHMHVENLLSALEKPNLSHLWEQVQRMTRDLALAYWEHHQEHHTEKTRSHSLPPITSLSKTMLPSSNGFRGLVQSFGPGLQPDLWNSETSVELRLSTPNRTLLKVRGDGEHEHKALHHYIMEEMGVEGLKHLVVLLDTYYAQTGARERKADASVSLRQLLIRMGYGNRADIKDDQRKLMHTLLYLSRTWIESPETTYARARPRRRGGKEVRSTEYTPLLVLERLKLDEIDGIKIPETVEFHLGAEFYDLLFGERQQYFTLPTADLLRYHGVREQQEICLAFYLSNFLILNGGRYGVNFPTMLTESGIRLAEDIEGGHDRLRDALRVVYALERLEKDGWIIRAAHPDIDTILAVEVISISATHKCPPGKHDCPLEQFAPATMQRIGANYAYLKGVSMNDLRRKRREASQHLLDMGRSDALQFTTGSLLKAQAEKREAQRQHAIAKSEAAQVARIQKSAKGKRR